MKRTIVLLATLLLSFGLVNAQDSVDVVFSPAPGGGETLWVGTNYTMEYWYGFDEDLTAFTTAYGLSSTDGATWNFTEGLFKIDWIYYPPPGCGCVLPETTWNHVVAVETGQMYPPWDIWDMAGLGLTIIDSVNDWSGDGMDKFGLGGVHNDPPICPSGAFQHTMSMFVTFGGVTGDDVAHVCLDTMKIGTSFDFLFVGFVSNNYIPGAWEVGTKCWAVKVMPNMPPQPDICPGDAESTDHCGSGMLDVTFTDLESDPITVIETGNDGNGTVAITSTGPGAATVTYTPGNPGDVGNTVTVTVAGQDAFGTGPDCTLQFEVTNNDPTATCPDDFAIGYGNLAEATVVGADVDLCDVLAYSVTNGPGTIDANGDWSWTPVIGDAGLNTVEVTVTDGYEDAVCTFVVEVLITVPFEITIQKTHGTLQGHFVDVTVDMIAGSEDMGGYDFLIGYDNSALTFIEATPGQLLVDCGWEYFTYRYSWNGNCGNACPSGLLRIVAISEINDGPNHPDCGITTEDPRTFPKNLAVLKFLVTNDRTFECMYVPIRFYWMDCGDNGISSTGGDTLYISKAVYEFEGGPVYLPGDYDQLPGWFGAPDICMVGDKVTPLRFIYFTHGGVDIICSGDIDGRGDINANGVMNEIADAVMFTNYFIVGLSAFGETAMNHIEASIAASDVNADGITLSVADLVYLIRVIIGDANAYPKPLPGTVSNISVQAGIVSYDASSPAGAGLFVFDINGDFDAPVLLAEGMDMTYGVNNDQLRVLVYNIGSNAIQAGDVISVNGDVELVEVEVADYDGFAMETAIHHLPSTFALAQNYPNPFNPKTNISLSLPQASEWTLTVFNVAGQKVKSYSGSAQAGVLDIVWDGTDAYGSTVASGIYFYKATANNFSETKKMVLMK
ncbi:MAG: T9SS type A sorting domain-containing protein [FCB group bacterium]|nr:T9SS type A sorting domain-containing protein [FCB group bacterium]